MAKKTKRRKWLYRKNDRWYGDFRPYADVGGGQEALKQTGERYATKDRSTAKKLAKERLAELRRMRRAGHGGRDVDLRRLGPFVDYHLACEAQRKGADPVGLAQVAQRLEVAIGFFGAETLLRDIGTMWVQEYVHYLAGRVRWEGTANEGIEPISPSTQRKYLRALSKAFRRARAVEVLPSHHRPFSDLMDLPEVEVGEAEWLDGPTAALLLEAARLFKPKRPTQAVVCAFTIIATLLLSGMRPSEGLGLDIRDVDFERKLIRVRRNRHRRLKNRGSRRVIPMWPQLEEILRAYLALRDNPTEGPLFPSPQDPTKPVRGIKRIIEELALRIGYEGKLTPKVFRHTYCAARLQTTEDGKPVGHLKVARELGHRGTAMVEAVYGHAEAGRPTFRRKPYVEILLEDYPELAGDRLEQLRNRSEERNAPAVCLANRVSPEVEIRVIQMAGQMPHTGPRKVSEALEDEGLVVSPSGVRWIWKRYGLHRAEFRLEASRNGKLKKVLEEVRALRCR